MPRPGLVLAGIFFILLLASPYSLAQGNRTNDTNRTLPDPFAEDTSPEEVTGPETPFWSSASFLLASLLVVVFVTALLLATGGRRRR